MKDNLSNQNVDKLVSVANASVSLVPVVGGLISELLTNIIPGQRVDRVVTFIRLLS